MLHLRKSTFLIVGLSLATFLLLGAAFYLQRISSQSANLALLPKEQLKIHYAGDPSIDLSSIKIKAFYFLPKDTEELLNPNWEIDMRSALDDLTRFYSLQLHGASTITYEIYPAPIIGEGKRLVYDSEETGGGNPHALIEIRKELLRRVFDRNGDLYKEDFSKSSAGSYDVIGIIYQGVGSSATLFTKSLTEDAHLISINEGEMPAFIVSHDYFVSPSYEDYGLSIFAHEFGHTLGLFDAYVQDENDPQKSNPTSDDIMGAGRYRPIDFTYLSKETRASLGLNY